MKRFSLVFFKYALIALMLIAADGPCFAFGVDASLGKIVYVSEPDVLYKNAEVSSEQYEVLPGQRLLVTNDVENGFFRTALLSDNDSTIQLIGYVKKQKNSASTNGYDFTMRGYERRFGYKSPGTIDTYERRYGYGGYKGTMRAYNQRYGYPRRRWP